MIFCPKQVKLTKVLPNQNTKYKLMIISLQLFLGGSICKGGDVTVTEDKELKVRSFFPTFIHSFI